MEIILNLLSTVITSSVIVGIIEFIRWKKDVNITNITNERKIWREEIRKIAEQISQIHNTSLLSVPISALKIRINTRGIKQMSIDTSEINDTFKKEEYFCHDTYIWKLINDYEQGKVTNENILCYKNTLINCISILLKYDWDKSKNEIRVSASEILNKTMYIILTLLLILILITHPGLLKLFEEGVDIFQYNIDSFFDTIVCQGVIFIVLPFMISYIGSRIQESSKYHDSTEIRSRSSFVFYVSAYVSIFAIIIILIPDLIIAILYRNILCFFLSIFLATYFMYLIYRIEVLNVFEGPLSYYEVVESIMSLYKAEKASDSTTPIQ